MAAVHISATLLLVAILLASFYSSANNLVTYVSKNGHNNKSCLMGGYQYPCHNLLYVMSHLLCNNINLEVHAHYTVVILYSHTVAKTLVILFRMSILQ